MTAPAPETCDICGASPVEIVLYPVAVHYKGSGFYSTDYGKGGKSAAKKDGGSGGDSGSSSGGDSSTKSDSGSSSPAPAEKKAAASGD
jgi:predicted nucleic acid-binding Zn ribbon protein